MRAAIGALAADVKWPFIGPAFGGIQRLVPRVQLVLTPPTPNLDIPNEDARAIDLEDSNLFALNRFPGYDRWEDGSRITYGVDWSLERPNLSITSNIGQSYRIVSRPAIFPEGTGLTDQLSDIVGRTRIRYGRLIDLTHRFRLDKSNFALRRSELDLTVGTDQTYVAGRLSQAQPQHRSDNRGSARQGGAAPGRPGAVPPLLVDLRRNRARPHRQDRGPAVASPTDSRRCGTASAFFMRTIVLSLA